MKTQTENLIHHQKTPDARDVLADEGAELVSELDELNARRLEELQKQEEMWLREIENAARKGASSQILLRMRRNLTHLKTEREEQESKFKQSIIGNQGGQPDESAPTSAEESPVASVPEQETLTRKIGKLFLGHTKTGRIAQQRKELEKQTWDLTEYAQGSARGTGATREETSKLYTRMKKSREELDRLTGEKAEKIESPEEMQRRFGEGEEDKNIINEIELRMSEIRRSIRHATFAPDKKSARSELRKHLGWLAAQARWAKFKKLPDLEIEIIGLTKGIKRAAPTETVEWTEENDRILMDLLRIISEETGALRSLKEELSQLESRESQS